MLGAGAGRVADRAVLVRSRRRRRRTWLGDRRLHVARVTGLSAAPCGPARGGSPAASRSPTRPRESALAQRHAVLLLGQRARSRTEHPEVGERDDVRALVPARAARRAAAGERSCRRGWAAGRSAESRPAAARRTRSPTSRWKVPRLERHGPGEADVVLGAADPHGRRQEGVQPLGQPARHVIADQRVRRERHVQGVLLGCPERHHDGVAPGLDLGPAPAARSGVSSTFAAIATA